MTGNTTPPPRRRRFGLIGCLGLFVIVFACVGVEFYRASRFDDTLAAANDARDRGDCAEAITLYDRAVAAKSFTVSESSVLQAEAAKQQCQALLDIATLGESGKQGEALVAYQGFIIENADSSLRNVALQRAHTLFTAPLPQALVSIPVCEALDSLITNELVPERDTNLPLLYAGCGQALYDAGNFSQAVILLQRLGVDYPDHPRGAEVEPLLASAIIAEAEQLGAGTIPPPQSTGGGTGSGPTTVIIQNDSPEAMSLVFQGPETRIESLPACETCESYTLVAPLSCPEQGPIGTYELPAGAYDVVVRSISGDNVTPFSGRWELGPGDEYYSCFYLVTR